MTDVESGNSELNAAKEKDYCNNSYCGVYQCKTYRKDGHSLFKLPKEVQNSPMLYYQWSKILRNGDPFPKSFFICARHFEDKHILVPRHANKEVVHKKKLLSSAAFPTLNLPQYGQNGIRRRITRTNDYGLIEPVVRILRKRKLSEIDPLSTADTSKIAKKENDSVKVFERVNDNIPVKVKKDVGTSINFDPCAHITLLCRTDKRLNVMTGLMDKKMLEQLTSQCVKMPGQDSDSYGDMMDKIVLTTFKLKTNVDFVQLGILFSIPENTAREYFISTIKCLAEIFNRTKFMQSKEQIVKESFCFCELFPKVRLFIECYTLKTNPPIKILVALAPSGVINYVSKNVNVRFSDVFVIRQTDLLKKLKPGDVLMARRDLVLAGNPYDIEIFNMDKKGAFQSDQRFTHARKRVELTLQKIRSFRIMTEECGSGFNSAVSQVVTVVCGLINESLKVSNNAPPA